MTKPSATILTIAIAIGVSTSGPANAQGNSVVQDPQATGGLNQIVIPTHSDGQIDITVNGRQTTASYHCAAPTNCNTAFLKELGIPIPPHEAWHEAHPGRSPMKHEQMGEVKSTAQIKLNLEVADFKRSGFIVTVMDQTTSVNPHIALGYDFFSPGSVVEERARGRIVFTPPQR